MLSQVGAEFIDAAGGIDNNFPSMAAQFAQGRDYILPRRTQNFRALPAVVIRNHAVKINRYRRMPAVSPCFIAFHRTNHASNPIVAIE